MTRTQLERIQSEAIDAEQKRDTEKLIALCALLIGCAWREHEGK